MAKRLHIIGAHKAGTTKLFELIAGLSGVRGTIPKQHLYFIENDECNFQDYVKYVGLDEVNNEVIVDATPDHLFTQGAMERIASLSCEMRVVISLRNPIDRAFSHGRMNNPGIDKMRFISVFESMNRKEIKKYSWVRRSLYYEDVMKALEIFGSENVNIILMEEWVVNPVKCLAPISDFLGREVTLNWNIASQNKRYNSQFIRSLVSVFKKFGLACFVPKDMRVRMRSLLVEIGPSLELSPREREIVKDVFQADVEKLRINTDIPVELWGDF